MPLHNFSRRRFLSQLAASISSLSMLLPAAKAAQTQRTRHQLPESADSGKPRVGIALGAGGANGLAHILMLEALDELSIRPHRIAGSSIGAIIGALYASGKTGKQIRELVDGFFISSDENIFDEIIDKGALRWVEFLEVELGDGGLLSSQNFISFLYDILKEKNMEELEIPLEIIAADLWNREQVVINSGPLLPAIKASMALPGVFKPEMRGERVLIDGGTVNPVPYDLLIADCDIVIAIDVSGKRTKPESLVPGYFETIFNSVKVMQRAIMTEKLEHNRPAIYITPSIVDIRALEFYRAKEVFTQAGPAKEELKKQLSKTILT